MLLLNEKYFLESQVQQILFGAEQACPACTYANRAVGRQSARLARQYSIAENQASAGHSHGLCVGHFQLLAADLAPESRLAGLTQYADDLGRVVRRMKELLRSARKTDAWPVEDAAATLNHALGLIAGRPMVEIRTSGAGLANGLDLCPTLVEAIACSDTCPLCIETERARQRWLLNVEKAAGFDEDAWLFFPTCPEHVSAIARLGAPTLTAAVVERALSVSLRYLRQQIQALVRAAELREEEAKIKAEGPEFWAEYKRRRPRRKIPGPKTPSHRLEKCPGCERIDVATDKATDTLLHLLNKKGHREVFSQGYGLCLKHFARVYLTASKGVVRAMLAEEQRGRLTEFTRNISNLNRRLPISEAALLRNVLVKKTLHQFCGFA